MRNIVLVICTLCLVTTAQVSAQSIQTNQQSVTQHQQAVPAQTRIQTGVQQHTVFKPVTTTTAEPAVYEQPAQAYQAESVYYQSSNRSQNYRPRTQTYYQPVRSFRPTRQVNFNSVPITQRPDRPGHVYGNTVRFFYRLGR